MRNLNCLMDHILSQVLKIVLNISSKKQETVSDNPTIIYVNKIENRITVRIKTGYYLELSKLETMKLPGKTKRKITKDQNG